jgi:2-oxoglutarate dehydrogenase E1 component
LDAFNKFSYLKSANVDYIDELLARFTQDPDSVDPSWRYFFEGMELGTDAPVSEVAIPNGHTAPVAGADFSSEANVAELITAYRERGRLLANINPLVAPPTSHPLLVLGRFGLTDAELPKTFTAGKMIGMAPATLSDILARLRETYCGSIGVEFTHIQNIEERTWLRDRMESSHNRPNLDAGTRQFILGRLTESETFERFLHTRYVAKKRFSIEGGESTIPALDCMIEIGAELGAKEFVIGMAHRGRLNVLVNIFGKKPEYIFTEFEGTYKADTALGEGDVKYHMGYSADIKTRTNKNVHLSLAFNPSHLEFVNPVTEGIARAKQDFLGDRDRSQVIPITIHGDAAFAGQGVCYETVQMSQLPGYATGGTLHIVINNQVGFTTSPVDSRSTTYSTDMAKMLETPIFHVNADDPEAVWYAAKLSIEYRQKFKKDVFIDLICYRKHGHNEGDEPSYTQPLLYKLIKAHPSTREIYAQSLVQAGIVPDGKPQELVDALIAKFTEAQARTRAETPKPYVSVFENRWKNLHRPTNEEIFKPTKTAISEKALLEIAEQINITPTSFTIHPKLKSQGLLEKRLAAVKEGKGIDWGNGEALAYGSLVIEGHAVRLTGQDAERGTFTHRHSVLNDFETGEKYVPLNHIRHGQAQYEVHNSFLSETAVMGFEYGYSIADPNAVVIWEAQFGDFSNGAQVIIDQFLSTSESKWQRMSGLTLLLPHGFEGQGPEHSSARLERFLQLCGRQNMSICNLTTPAQIFHALRRQVLRDFRKPLVVMSPKSLLRHPMAVSTIDDFTKMGFQEVIDDDAAKAGAAATSKIKRVLLCSGKIYYDLLAARTEKKASDVAIVRIEQLYPWPATMLAAILAQYNNASEIFWVQEEPRNMGAWSFIFNMWMGGFEQFMDQVGGRPIRYVGREICASPAVGSEKIHHKEQEALVNRSFQ